MMPELVEEVDRTGFETAKEPHPSSIVDAGAIRSRFGIRELRNAIPPHCFEPSLIKSFATLSRDLTYTGLMVCFFLFAIPKLVQASGHQWLYYFLVNLYGFSQGIVVTGLWVLAHECGHSAFSKHSLVNDTVGWILHSALLTPYFSWKSTHRRHHIYANNMEKDHNYVPTRRDTYLAKLGLKPKEFNEVLEDTPAVLFVRILFQQLIGWNWYLLSNITCAPTAVVRPNRSAWRNSHLDPWGSLFRDSERLSIVLSDMGCFTTVFGLFILRNWFDGWAQVFWIYVVPWMWLNHWIVMITYLHHTHPSLPKFNPEDWDFLNGAMATMDRDFGLVGKHFFHRISSDHVTHHLFSKIPHYYARDATKAVVPLLGDQYKTGPFSFSQLKLAFSRCQWVEEDDQMDDYYFPAPRDGKTAGGSRGLWYKAGPCPRPEFSQRTVSQDLAGEQLE